MGQPRGKLGSASGRTKKRREYNLTLTRAEQELAAVQRAYAEEQQRCSETQEKNMILAEMLDIQDRAAAVYEKHQHWMAAGGPTEAHPEQASLGLQQLGADRPRWVMFLLETATWEQQQRAVSMSTADWCAYHWQYCADLRELMEIQNKCPDVQSLMLSSVRAAVQPPPAAFPAVYASSSSRAATPSRSWGPAGGAGGAAAATAAAAAAAAAGSTDKPLQASDVILYLVQTTGILAHVALLHGCPAIFEAASFNMLTGEMCQASPMHWIYVARRMQFSRQQKVHFKLALQVFARQAKAAAAAGITILQETPSYAFLLACETIAARQLSSEGSPAPTADDWQDMPAQHAEAAAGSDTTSQGVPSTSDKSPPRLEGAGQPETSAQWQAAGPASATAAATASAAAAATTAAAAAETGGRRSGAGGGSTSTDGMQGDDGAPQLDPATEQEGMLVDTPAEDLQRQVKLYFRNVVNLNIFLADTLTLDQALLLNVASFPFWPMLSAVAEAAIQLPDDDTPVPEDTPHMQGVQLLMRQRRSFMQQLHSDWIGDVRDDAQQHQQGRPPSCDPSMQQ